MAIVPSLGRQAQSPAMETLERRMLLSGVVTVAVVKDVLVLTGDNQANQIHLSTSGQPAGTIKVTGLSGTTLQGSATPAVPSGQVRIVLKNGNDAVQLEACAGLKGLQVDGGAGDLDLALISATQVLSGGLSVKDSGWATVLVRGAMVKGGVTIKSAQAHTTIDTLSTLTGLFVQTAKGAGSLVLDNSALTGSVVLTSGRGDVTIRNHAKISGPVTVKNGKGSDHFEIADDADDLGGSVWISNGAGGSDVTILKNLGGGITVNSGAGADNLTITSVDINGSLTVTNGTGGGATNIYGTSAQDVVYVNKSAGASLLFISCTANSAYFDQGYGDGQLAVGSTIAHDLTIHTKVPASGGLSLFGSKVSGKTTVLATKGNNIITANYATFADFTLTTGGGADQFHSAVATFNGTVTINTGAGADVVTIDDGTFKNVFAILGGAGNDQLSIETQTTQGKGDSEFDGVVAVGMGAGADLVRIGGLQAEMLAHFKVASAFDGGAGQDTMQRKPNTIFNVPPVTKSFEL